MSQSKDYKKKYYIVEDVKDQEGGFISYTVPQYYPLGISRPILKIPSGPPMPYGNSLVDLPSGMVTPVKTSSLSNMISSFLPGTFGQTFGQPFAQPFTQSYNQTMSPTMNALITPSMRPISPMAVQPLSVFSPMGPMLTQPFVPTGANIMGSPILASNVLIPNNITIRIIGPFDEFYIRVPFRYMRNVIDDLYFMIAEKKVDDNRKVAFNIISPTLNTTINTSVQNMVDVIKKINDKYSSYLNYAYPDGRRTRFRDVWNGLLAKLLTNGIELNGDYKPIEF